MTNDSPMSAGERPDSSWRDAAICGALFTAAMAYFALSFPYSFELQDEGYFNVLNSLVATGGMPHRDFTDLYGPGVYWLNGVVHSASGGQILAVRVGIAVFKAGAVVLTFVLVRGLVSLPFAILGALLATLFWGRAGWALNTPYAVLYTVPLCMAACRVLIRALERGARLGFFASGLIAGCAILFKHSLALLCIGGMGVAIWSVSLLEASPQKGSRSDLAWGLVPLGAAAVAILAPFLSMLSLRDYLIHFLPFHLLLGLVTATVIRQRPGVKAWPIVTRRIAPFAFGVALAPALVVVVYASRGAFDTLVHDMFVVPTRMQNYYIAARTPPWEAAVFAMGVFCVISACLLALRGRRGLSLAVAAPGFAALWLAVSQQFSGNVPPLESSVRWLQPRLFDEIFGPATVLAAAVAFAPLVLKQPLVDRRTLRSTLPLLFLGSMLLFQAFPRASFSSWVVEAASVPVLTWALFRWRELGVGEASQGFRRCVATLLVLVMPLWMTSHAVARDGPIRQLAASRRALDLPATTGIALDARGIRIRKIVPLEALIAHLGDAEPGDAPILLLGNSWMAVFLSGRPTLFPKRSVPLVLMALDMLPDAAIEELDEPAMLERLRRTPEVIVIDERGPGSMRMRAALPRLSAFVDREFTSRTSFGPFRVLRRARR